MFQRGADIEAIDTMRGKGGALGRGVMDDDTGARNCKGSPVKIEVANEACMGGQFGLSTR
jgi:hypothetical protein